MSKPSVYVLHNCDYGGIVDRMFHAGVGKMKRLDAQTFEIEADILVDDRTTWFFKGMSVPVVNHLLKVVSCRSNVAYTHDLSMDAIRAETVPYDDMSFTVNGEDLQVVYSIQDALSSRFRQSMIGPDSIALYEREQIHFGPILVYKCKRDEIMHDDSSWHVVHRMLPIESDVCEIHNALEGLNFGG